MRSAITLFLVVAVLAAASIILTTKRETLELDDGSCDCCSCGWQSCRACAANIGKCCGKGIGGFTRYTFNLPTRRGEDPNSLDLISS